MSASLLNRIYLPLAFLLLLSIAIACGSDDDPVAPELPKETTAPGDVTDIRITATTDTSATLAWTAPGDDGMTGTASQYDIRYSTSVITDANFSSATQVSSVPPPRYGRDGGNVYGHRTPGQLHLVPCREDGG